MHPWITSDRPGQCTICGMDLVAIYEGEAGFGQQGGVVVLHPASPVVAGITTGRVERATLRRDLNVLGFVQLGETRPVRVPSPVSGVLRELRPRGDDVLFRGDVFAVLDGTNLVAAGERLRAAREAGTLPAVQAQLTEEGWPESVLADLIEATEETGLMVRMPVSGRVQTGFGGPGAPVQRGDDLLEVWEQAPVFLIFDAYPGDRDWFEVGQRVGVTHPDLPQRVFQGEVSYITPAPEPRTGVVKVRVTVDDERHAMPQAFDMQMTVSAAISNAVVVPRSAVLHFGDPVVYVQTEPLRFERRRVELGRAGDTAWEVRGGIETGTPLATGGLALLESQALLASGGLEAGARMGLTRTAPAPVGPPIPIPDESLIVALDRVSQDLAMEDWEAFVEGRPALLTEAWRALRNGALERHAAREPQLREGLKQLEAATTLREAQDAYELVSDPLVAFILDAARRHPGRVDAHFFECPMTRVLGETRWLQKGESLRNPFYGSEMLECGMRVKP